MSLTTRFKALSKSFQKKNLTASKFSYSPLWSFNQVAFFPANFSHLPLNVVSVQFNFRPLSKFSFSDSLPSLTLLLCWLVGWSDASFVSHCIVQKSLSSLSFFHDSNSTQNGLFVFTVKCGATGTKREVWHLRLPYSGWSTWKLWQKQESLLNCTPFSESWSAATHSCHLIVNVGSNKIQI